jgi:superfamily II DNA or RNA helicase
MITESSPCIKKSKLKLRPHQIKAVKSLLSDNIDGLLVIHPTGYGKTLTAVAASQCYLDSNPKHSIIFIGPSSLISNFDKELDNYGVEDKKPYKLYSYQKFLQLDDEKRNRLCSRGMMIVDEVHNLRNLNLKNPKQSKRSKSVMACSRLASKRLLLSATPFVNDLTDFIPIINFLYGRIMLYKKSSAKQVRQITPYLRDRIHFIELGKGNEKDYPDFTERYIRIKMDPEYEDDYCKAIKGFEIKEDRFENPEAFYNAHRRAVNKIGQGNEYFSEKMEKALKLIGDKKTLIYSNWIDFGLKPIKEILEERKIKTEVFSGETSERDKKKIVDNFNKNKFQVLIVSKSGSEGLDLKEVRNVIVMDPVWNYSGIEQIRGRAIRYRSHSALPKRDRDVTIYYMILETRRDDCKSGDTIVYDIVKRKKGNYFELIKELRKVSI